ncbi:MAG: DUF72 domain-containing protein [Actinomycetota bacterium]
MARVFVGTSGYNYLHWWNGVFYPPDVPPRRWLEFYAQHFDTVELNVSFYRLPRRNVFEGWRNRTPNNFIFAVKGSRFITHVKKLAGCEDPLKLFFDNASGLKEKLGIVLWQLPPGLHMDRKRLEKFCELLAQNEIARNTRHAFEFRHKSWFCDEIYELLSKYNFSLCVAHSNRWPFVEISTADFVYLRFHGGEILYGSNYSDDELKDWSSKAKKWLDEGRYIYAYFNNDAYGFAIYNALKLRELIQG